MQRILSNLTRLAPSTRCPLLPPLLSSPSSPRPRLRADARVSYYDHIYGY